MLDTLSSQRMMFPQMSRLQETRPFETNMQLLEVYARYNSDVVLIKDGTKVVASMVCIPLQCLSVGVALAAEVGIDPNQAVLQSMVFVHPSYRGRGLSRQLMDEAVSRPYALVYGYDTPEILSWFKAQKKFKDTKIKDARGDPVLVAELTRKQPA